MIHHTHQEKCLPEEAFIDNTSKECLGDYYSTLCIKVNGLESSGVRDMTPLNAVIKSLLEEVKLLKEQLNQ